MKKFEKRNIIFAFSALSLAGALFGGCQKDEPQKGGTEGVEAPKIVAFSPENGSKDLKGTTLQIVLTFDQNVKCPSSEHSKFTVDHSATVDKVFAYNKDVTISVSGLLEGVSYTLSIPSGVISGYKNNPFGGLEYTFSMKASEKDYALAPASSLTNAKATDGAKKLYALLLENYGKKTFSGAMGGTAWETTYSDCVASAAGGKYPAVVGFDYLFFNWPAKKWDGCPDYGDITPVKAAWDAGNIIQIGWHWSVPSVQDETDLNNYSFYAPGKGGSSKTTTFDVREALSDGTWQRILIDNQIERLAGYMTLLQNAGIPVLFRPLHEAAGDYKWGAWFWWGAKGAEPCVQLWKYLRKELETTYSLNNLVWVWTVQTSTAGAVNSESLDTAREWYPGDEYVDIVGADLYEAKGTTQSAAFKFVNNSVRGNKMVVLSEFGNLLDISGAYSEGAPWGYMMNWCNYENGSPVLYCRNSDGSYSWNNTADDWKAALSGDRILNRGDYSVK